jgi:hypothetical protein
MKFYLNEKERSVNTLSPDFAALQRERCGRDSSAEVVVKVRTLGEILRTHKLDDRPIQFLSVDVEGLDLEVLESNDWSKYIPNVILCEDLGLRDLETGPGSGSWKFLHDRGYSLLCKCVHTLVFAHHTFEPVD